MTPCVQFDRVSKRYRIGRAIPSLRSLVGNWRDPSAERYHWAVEDVSFELQPGEALGIIGPNGAGKTTILKLLSNVTYPTSGRIRTNGRFSALIELGAGFHPDLTGRENIYLNGTILGLRNSDIRARFDDIVDFAGIGQYLDTPVKRYSSGMYARLGFAVAAHVNPDVLLVDEVLAVGDYAFQMRCYKHMDELRANGTSLIFVSHNMEVVRRVCNKGLVMYRGRDIFQGSAVEAIVAYSNAIRQAARKSKVTVPEEGGLRERVMTFDAEIENIALLDATGRSAIELEAGAKAKVAVDVWFHKAVHQPVFAFTIRTPEGRVVHDTTTRWMNIQTPDFAAGERCRVEFTIDVSLLEGSYEVGADVAANDLGHYYDRVERAMSFWVKNRSGARGVVDLKTEVAFINLASDVVAGAERP